MCRTKHSVTTDFVREERWQSGRMRIIANDVTPEMGSEGSNPSLSAHLYALAESTDVEAVSTHA